MKKSNMSVHPEYRQRLIDIAALAWTPETVRTADDATLLKMQYRLGAGDVWGVWMYPEHFMHDGGEIECKRIFRQCQYLSDDRQADTPEAHSAWREIVRFAIARSMFPSANGDVVKPSTVTTTLDGLKKLVSEILKRPQMHGIFWSQIREDEVFRALGNTKPKQSLVAVLAHYYRMGCLPDCIQSSPTIRGDEPERDRRGEQEVEAEVEAERQWQPFPDLFVSEMGWRSLRIINVISPVLLDALEAAVAINIKEMPNGKLYSVGVARVKTRLARDILIKNWVWQTETGEGVNALGFDCYALTTGGGGGGGVKPLDWPPSTFYEAIAFGNQLVKSANLWAVVMGNAPRNSEVGSMRDDCLVEASNGNYRWKGKTFKMSGIIGGREIDAIVPDIITLAIVQQIRLARIMRNHLGHNGNALWVGIKTDKNKSLTQVLNRYMVVLGLGHLLDKDNPSCHEHRFRKTLARIVALALVNATLILKDCFGHDDVDMTIRSYILSDPAIVHEVLLIQKELVVLKAVDVINDLDTVGGPGAVQLRKRASAFLKRIGKTAFEPQDTYEFARRETFDGRSWMVVGPGIICTAPHEMDGGGPCNKGQRGPNPANCKTGCDRQLLENYAATYADDTVAYVLENLQCAIDEDETMMVPMWAGQLKTWLYRYEQVAEKWKDHPLVEHYGQRPKRIMLEVV